MGRKPCCAKVGLNRGGWNALEDQILTNYIKANGEGKWRQLPKKAGKTDNKSSKQNSTSHFDGHILLYVKAGLKRCGKSCRLRWLNYLSPKLVRGNITQEEEDLIIELHKQVGNRWSLIAAKFPGRTDNEIKNFWNTVLGKKVCGMQTVPKRKHRKRENGMKPNSSSVPRRRATVQPTQLQHSNSSSLPSLADFPALISESTDAVVTPQNSVTQKENRTHFRGDIKQNIANNSSPQHLAPEEGYNPQQSESVRENNTEFAADTLKSIANDEASGSHVHEQFYTPQVSSQENNTDFMDEIMQYIANTEAPQSHVYDGCDSPQQLVLPQENGTELMGDMMQNTIGYEKCYSPQESGSYPDEITEYMEDIMQNIDFAGGPQSDVYENCHSQQKSGSSQASDSTEFKGEKMENIINLEPPQGDVYGKCYAQQQSGSSQGDCTEFMAGITRDIVGIVSPERHVYEKCYHELMSDLGTEETFMPDMEDFSVQTYLGIFSELTFT